MMPVESTEVKALLEKYSFFDQPLVEHGFMAYNRDYRVVAEITGRRLPGGKVVIIKRYVLLFRGCVETHYTTNVHDRDLDDIFIDHRRWEAAGRPEGFVWGLNFADAYPGARLVEDSQRATAWRETLDRAVHEVVIETNIYDLALVFAELSVTTEDVGSVSQERTLI
jgi:hypothetical protein